MPPESWCGKAAPCPARPTRASAAPHGGCRRRPALPAQAERQVDVLERVRPGHQRRLLEHEADAPGERRVARHHALARRLEPGDEAQRRRLAAARRPEQREALARADREVEPGERAPPVREGLADARERARSGALHGAGGLAGRSSRPTPCPTKRKSTARKTSRSGLNRPASRIWAKKLMTRAGVITPMPAARLSPLSTMPSATSRPREKASSASSMSGLVALMSACAPAGSP